MIRHIRWQIVLVVLGVILSGVLLSYQAVGLEEIFIPASGGTLVEALVGGPQNLNPLYAPTNPVDRDISALIFEGLTRYDETGRLVGDLATGWNISLDGLTYTFWLRQDVRWQDGIPFAADDVLYTVGIMQDPGYTGPADLAALWRTVEVVKLNTYTVVFTLAEPYAPFLDYTTIGILPIHLLQNVSAGQLARNDFNQNPVGTGRFQLAGAWDDEHLLLAANPLYRDRRPKLAGIEFRFFPSHGAALAALEAGQVHSVSNIQWQDIPHAQSLPDLNLFTSSLPRHTAILLNLRNDALPFFLDKTVRQALLTGLDRPALIAQVLNGQGTVADSPLYPGSWAYFGDIQTYPFDPDRAAELLDSAGWLLPEVTGEETMLEENDAFQQGVRAKEDQELSFRLLAIAGSLQQDLAQQAALQWARIGVRATVIPVEPADLPRMLQEHDFDAAIVDVDMRGDPDLYALWSESAIEEGQNYGGWQNRPASETLEQARTLSNPGQRTILYYRFQQLFADELPALLLYYHTYSYGVSSQVQQVSMGPLTDPSDRFATVADWFLAWREVIIRKTKPNQP